MNYEQKFKELESKAREMRAAQKAWNMDKNKSGLLIQRVKKEKEFDDYLDPPKDQHKQATIDWLSQ